MARELFPTGRLFLFCYSWRAPELVFFYRLSAKKRESRALQGAGGHTPRSLLFAAAATMLTQISLFANCGSPRAVLDRRFSSPALPFRDTNTYSRDHLGKGWEKQWQQRSNGGRLLIGARDKA